MAKKENYWNEDRIKELKELVDRGIPTKDIADHFGKHIGAIHRILSRSEIRIKARPGSPKVIFESTPDLATRIRVLLGIEKRTDKPKAQFTDEQIKKWIGTADGCVLFCKEIWDIDLQDYQVQMIKDMLNHKRCVFIIGRQAGKDFCLSCFAVWKCVTSPNEKIILVSPAQRQSELLYNRILNLIGSSNELYDSILKSNMEMCRFTNGSEIYSLPSTGHIRGYTQVTYAILNESCWGIPDDVFAAIEPMLAIKNGTLVCVSSAGSCMGRTWEYFNNPLFTKLRLPSTVNKYLDKEWLELQKQTMSGNVYDMEINAQFSQLVDNYFKLETINKVTESYDLTSFPEKNKNYYAGIDWGREHDSSVVIIGYLDSEGNKKVTNIIEMRQAPFTIQVERIKRLHEIYKFKKIVAEYAGLGIGPAERLKENGLPVDFFEPTTKNKEVSYMDLLQDMEHQKIIIPNHPKLQYELRIFKYEMTAQGQTKLHHADIVGATDDFCDALMMFNKATKRSGFACYVVDMSHRPLGPPPLQ